MDNAGKRPLKRKPTDAEDPAPKRPAGGILAGLLNKKFEPDWAHVSPPASDASSSDDEADIALRTAGGLFDDATLRPHTLDVVPLPDPNTGHKHRATIASIAFSPDPSRPLLLTASPDRVVSIHPLHLEHYATLIPSTASTMANASKRTTSVATSVAASRSAPLRTWLLRDCPVLSAVFSPARPSSIHTTLTPAAPHRDAAFHSAADRAAAVADAAATPTPILEPTCTMPLMVYAAGTSPLLYALDVETGAARSSDALCAHLGSRRNVRSIAPIAVSTPLSNVRTGLLATAAGRSGTVQLLSTDTLRVVSELHLPGVAAGVRVCFGDGDADSHRVFASTGSSVFLYDVRRPNIPMEVTTASAGGATGTSGTAAPLGDGGIFARQRAAPRVSLFDAVEAAPSAQLRAPGWAVGAALTTSSLGVGGSAAALLGRHETDAVLTASALGVSSQHVALGGRAGEVAVFGRGGGGAAARAAVAPVATRATRASRRHGAASAAAAVSDGAVGGDGTGDGNMLSEASVFLNLRTHIDTVQFSPCGDMLAAASASAPEGVRLFHLPTMTTYANFPSRDAHATQVGSVRSLAFSPGGGYIAMGTDAGRARLFRLTHFSGY